MSQSCLSELWQNIVQCHLLSVILILTYLMCCDYQLELRNKFLID